MWDPAESRSGGHEALSPMQIAHHPLFTAREKIELLQHLKAEATSEHASEQPIGVTAEEIDEAIEEVKLGAREGAATETVARGVA